MSVELFPQNCESLFDSSKFGKVKKNIDHFPDGQGVGQLFEEIVNNPIVVISYPGGVLFKAKITCSLPAEEEELDGKTYIHTFINFCTWHFMLLLVAFQICLSRILLGKVGSQLHLLLLLLKVSLSVLLSLLTLPLARRQAMLL